MTEPTTPATRNFWWSRPLTRFQTTTGLMVSILLIGAVAATAYTIQWRNSPFLSGGAAAPSGSRPSAPQPFQLAEGVFSIIPEDEIYAGGPPKDGIPAITNPKTESAISAGLQPADRVIGVAIGGESRAYPLRILNWHEITNDTLGGKPIAVTYCPLCDSAVVFNREVGGVVREFGVSGLLYNSNVLMYDRQETEAEESLWSQMLLKAVVGPAAEEGLALEIMPAQLTTWEAWVARHPETTSQSFETGHGRNYDLTPYSQYFASEDLMFPVKPVSHPATDVDEVLGKEPVIVIAHEGQLKGYPASRLKEALKASGAEVVTDSFSGRTVVLTPVDVERGMYHVTYSDGSPAPTVYSFWFEFRAMHPEAEVYKLTVATSDSEDGPTRSPNVD